MSQVKIVVGSQWGDEGKGKWIDAMASQADLVARFQGGNNAGHTLYIQGEKIVLHQIPSGILHPGKKSVVAAGVVLNPVALLAEMDDVKAHADVTPENFWISSRAHVITPWHIHRDCRLETSSSTPIGTTKRGIGPTYTDRASRAGLRTGAFVEAKSREAWIESQAKSDPEFAEHLESQAAAWAAFRESADIIRPYVCEAEVRLRQEVADGRSVLLEGAQGTLLDINYGTYPFVTSSSTTAGGALASTGLHPRSVSEIIGIAKAYLTRVGEGPFPTELQDDLGSELARKGHEFGATTGRPRRCGWFDAVAMRHAVLVNGLDGIYLNKMDVLSGFETLKVAVAYSHPELGKLEEFPADAGALEQITPIYEEFSGWNEDISGETDFDKLPANAQSYIRGLEDKSGIRILYAGTGPNRQDALPVPPRS